MNQPSETYRKPTVEALREIFGKDTIFHPCRKKEAFWGSWQKRTVLDMDAKAIRKTDLAAQTGVLCGANSDGLVCLDLDTLDGLAAFTKALPPDLRTTRVIGKPGRAKFFFRVPRYDAGRKRELKRNGAKAGDYIANGAQAVVAGIHHETGEPYRIEDTSPPIQTTLEKLNEWLKAADFQPIRTQAKHAPACVVVCSNEEDKKNPLPVSPESENEETRLAEIERRIAHFERADQRAAELPDGIRELFQKHVQERWNPEPAGRNRFIVEAVPVLIRRMSPARVLAVCMAWLQVHREYFNDTEEQHAAETSTHIDATLATYRQNLRTRERGIYDSLSVLYRDAFRICRDLARCDGPPPPQFFLSADELAQRLGTSPSAATNMLRKLAGLQIFTKTERGTKRAAGVQGRANKWQWNMSLEPFEQIATLRTLEPDAATKSAPAVEQRNDKKQEEPGHAER